MTTPRRDHEALLSAYLAVGMEVLPDGVVDAVLDEVHRTRQRTVIGPWRTRPVSRTTFAAAAVVALLALGAALLVVAGGPSPTPSEEPSPSLPAIVAPSSTPRGPSAGPTASPVTSAAGLWIATGTMGSPRLEHAAVRLPDGRVLVAGGSGTGDDAPQRTLTSAELYDPDNGTWSPTGNMLKPQAGFPATLLRDGRVLVGDVDDPAVDTSIIGADSIIGSEVYDPATGTWSSAGTVFTAEDRRDADRGGPWSRLAHGATATLLRDGRVLVAGQSGARVYDPDSGAWSATEKLITPRHDHTATLLGDGTVLVAGGTNGGDRTVYSAELYDPDTGSWTAIANTHRDGCVTAGCPEGGSTATLLHDGTVLFMRFEFAEIYDPATGVWTPARKQPESGSTTKTPLLDGSVLMAGLKASPAVPQPPCAAAALYDPRTGSWTTTSSVLRCGSSFTLLLDGTVLVAGGSDCSDGGVCVATGSAERYVPAGVSPPLASLPEPDPGPDAVPARARTTPGLVTSFSLIRVSTSASTSGRR